MRTLQGNIRISEALYAIIEAEKGDETEKTVQVLATIVREFRDTNEALLRKRKELQTQVDVFFDKQKGKALAPAEVVQALKKIGYVDETPAAGGVTAKNLPPEITSIPGPQLVVPADKANMVLNAHNARWVSLYDAVFTSNLVEAKEDAARRKETIEYANRFLDKIVTLEAGTSFEHAVRFDFDKPSRRFTVITPQGEAAISRESEAKLIGVRLGANDILESFILEHNTLKIEVLLGTEGVIRDIMVEASITYIIDLEDASISAPENKYLSYANIQGIARSTLECEVRGSVRSMARDDSYMDAETLEEKSLARGALALVRDVGPHLYADASLITIDDKTVPEKILDSFMTTLLGMRYHVAPKLHGAEEVAFNVALLKAIAKALGLPEDANKIGVMNEEIRTNGQLAKVIGAARDILFFTNSGFLDYTGSFIDLMMHQGAVASYRALASKRFKTAYEEHNVYVSLALGVPQIGAGMWAKIRDMKGLFENKMGQVRSLNDTGWSPSPMAAAIHTLAYHLAGYVKALQSEYNRHPKQVPLEEMVDFPKAEISALTPGEIRENLEYAIHGLLAYAEPWVRRGIGCSGVKDLGGEPLMEDRATARIKAAFVRNWLLHGVTNKAQVADVIGAMARLVDEQNLDTENYEPLYTDSLDDHVVKAVYDLVFNPEGYHHSYVEPYFYAGYLRAHAGE